MTVKLSIFLSLFLLFHKANAFNITLVLSQFPDLSNFNTYLTNTNLAGDINSRQTITVLAVANNDLSSLSGKSLDIVKKILSVHVILDYFDVPKLHSLTNRTAMVTTLFQTTGLAKGQQGFLNITNLGTDTIVFGSAIPGSRLGSNLVKPIVSHPSNLSVLLVSSVIIPQGIDGMPPSPSKSPSISPAISPTPSISPIPSPSTSVPPTSSHAPAPSTAEVPAPSSPPIPDAPTAVTPVAAVPAADAPAEDPAADAPAKVPPGAGTGLQLSLGFVFSMVLSNLFLAPGTLN